MQSYIYTWQIIWVFVIVFLLGSWITPYYQHRLNQSHKHHQILLSGHCEDGPGSVQAIVGEKDPDKGERLGNIHYIKLSYEGTVSNCDMAKVYYNTPVILGALQDMWVNSIFHTLLTAGNFYLQILYGVAFIAGIVITIRTWINANVQMAWASNLMSSMNQSKSPNTISMFSPKDQKPQRIAIVQK